MVFKTIGIIGKGFIGTNLYNYLSNYFECHWVKESNLKEFDVIINANGNSNKRLPDIDSIKDFDLTVRNTLNSLIEYKCKKYIYISSCEVYGEKTKEDSEINVDNISRYGLSKYLSECLVRNYSNDWLILRINAPLGRNLRKGPFFDIMFGDKLWISSKSKFQAISTEYIAKFIKYSIQNNICNEIFNIAGKDTIELEKVMDIIGRKIPSPENPVIEHSFNIDKINQLLSVPSCYETICNFKKEL